MKLLYDDRMFQPVLVQTEINGISKLNISGKNPAILLRESLASILNSKFDELHLLHTI